MPPKDDKPHQIFISADGGETFSPLGRITEVDLASDDEPSEEDLLNFQYPEEMNFTATVHITKTMMLWLAHGRKAVPNNWLKAHGHPMVRRRWLKRYWKAMRGKK